jgi:hypothetical protein
MSEFLMPGVDDDPSTEAGVILLGLDAERLLAGLAAAARADDPGLVRREVLIPGGPGDAHRPPA